MGTEIFFEKYNTLIECLNQVELFSEEYFIVPLIIETREECKGARHAKISSENQNIPCMHKNTCVTIQSRHPRSLEQPNNQGSLVDLRLWYPNIPIHYIRLEFS